MGFSPPSSPTDRETPLCLQHDARQSPRSSPRGIGKCLKNKIQVQNLLISQDSGFHINSWLLIFFYFPTHSATHLKIFLNYFIQKFQMFCTRRVYTDIWSTIWPETKDLWHTLLLPFSQRHPIKLSELQLKMFPSSEKFSFILIPQPKLASYYFLSQNKLLFPSVTFVTVFDYTLFSHYLSLPLSCRFQEDWNPV